MSTAVPWLFLQPPVYPLKWTFLFSLFKEEPRKVCFTYDLFLNLEGNPPVNHLRCEKLTFNNPTIEFRYKLLMAGGVSVPKQVGPAPARTDAASLSWIHLCSLCWECLGISRSQTCLSNLWLGTRYSEGQVARVVPGIAG